MLNIIWLSLMLIAIIFGVINGTIPEVVSAVTDSAMFAVELALMLVAIMIFWLGIMRIASDSGLVQTLGRGLRPVMKRLFPDVPTEHPAMGAMIMNIAANMLGLGNAATPMGLKAMNELQKLNPHPKVASNSMCMFLAINTSSVQLVPASAIAYLAAAGSANPTSIIGTALLATACSTAVAITAAKLLQRLPRFRVKQERAYDECRVVE